MGRGAPSTFIWEAMARVELLLLLPLLPLLPPLLLRGSTFICETMAKVEASMCARERKPSRCLSG